MQFGAGVIPLHFFIYGILNVSRGNLIIIDQAGFAELDRVIVNGCEDGRQEPSGGVAHGDGQDLVAHPGHDKQVHLTEGNEGGQHDDHGNLAVACTPEGTGVDLIKDTENVERCDPMEENGTELHDFRLGIEEFHDVRRKNDHGDHHDRGGSQGDEQGIAHTLPGPLRLILAQILTHEGGGGQGDGLHGQEDQLIHLGVGSPAGHTIRTEEIDVRLNENIGEGGHGHL